MSVTPIMVGGLTAVGTMDCIRYGPEPPDARMDEQRYELFFGNRTDSKLALLQFLKPWRTGITEITMTDRSGLVPLEAGGSYWTTAAWGSPSTYTGWIASSWYWDIAGDSPSNPMDPDHMLVAAGVMQVLGAATYTRNYELWKTTWNVFASPGDPGYPSTTSTWLSAGSGSLVPGDILTIPIPIDDIPASPAPPSYGSPYTEGDWSGWGVGTFLIWTS